MDEIQGINETRTGNTYGRKTDETAKFDLNLLSDNTTQQDLKAKATEIINKNISLIKYQKELYRQKFEYTLRYNKQKQTIELTEINNNLAKKKTQQLTKTQLDVLIDSKLDQNVINKIDEINNEISICELISKSHYLVSDQIKNYNLSDSTYRKYINNDKTL